MLPEDLVQHVGDRTPPKAATHRRVGVAVHVGQNRPDAEPHRTVLAGLVRGQRKDCRAAAAYDAAVASFDDIATWLGTRFRARTSGRLDRDPPAPADRALRASACRDDGRVKESVAVA